MSPRTLIISAAVAAALTAGTAQAAGPLATASRGCGDFRNLGATYVNELTAKGVGCSKAKDVARAFNACRHKHGVSGHCSSKVSGGFKCSEGARQTSPIQYNARVGCKKGGKRVKFIYAENT